MWLPSASLIYLFFNVKVYFFHLIKYKKPSHSQCIHCEERINTSFSEEEAVQKVRRLLKQGYLNYRRS